MPLFLFFFVLAAWAQTPTVSPELVIAPREDYRFVGKVRDTAIVLLYEEEQFRLALYDEKLQVKITPPIRPERGNIDILKDITDKDFFTVIYRYNVQGKSADASVASQLKRWSIRNRALRKVPSCDNRA